MADPIVFYSGPIVTWLLAKAAKLPRYFTGEPCGRGHIEQRATANRRCRACLRADDIRTRRGNPKYQARERARRAANPEASRLIQQRYRAKNLDRARERTRDWMRAHYDASAKDRRKAYVAANRDKYRALVRKWQKSNPEKRSACDRINRARRRGAPGHCSATELIAIRGAQNDRCPYCSIDLQGGGQVDHKMPIASGGTNWPDNLQWTCARCNRAKWAMTDQEFRALLAA